MFRGTVFIRRMEKLEFFSYRTMVRDLKIDLLEMVAFEITEIGHC
jgi:hypothetical protein